MKEFRGKVAVITGAASGIGRALADLCVLEGIKSVLGDLEVVALAATEASLRASGATRRPSRLPDGSVVGCLDRRWT